MLAQGEGRWWSWRTVAEHGHRLGIPNFQRGQVWEQGNRTALLESMLEGSPCGTFVFWRPTGVAATQIGISLLDPRVIPDEPIWIVDGQQRCRALLGILQEMLQIRTVGERHHHLLVRQQDLHEFDGSSMSLGSAVGLKEESTETVAPGRDGQNGRDQEADSPNGGGAVTWFACLPALHGLRLGPEHEALWREWSSARNVTQSSVFRSVREADLWPEDQQQKSSLPHGLVPLAALVNAKSVFAGGQAEEVAVRLRRLDAKDRDRLTAQLPWGPLFLTGQARAGWDSVTDHRAVLALAALFEDRQRELFARFASLFDAERFAVGFLPSSGLREAISAYVRINRAGVRVQAEERALASLTRWHEGLLTQLAAFLRDRDEQQGEVAEYGRAELLAHGADKLFGFALWMRVIARYSVLRALPLTGRSWVDPDSVERPNFSWQLESRSDAGEIVRSAAEQASAALLFLDSVLTVELRLDHRMARPATSAIWPLVEVLAHFPPHVLLQLRESKPARQAVARALLWTALHPYIDQAEMKYLCTEIHGTPRSDRSPWAVAEDGAALSQYLPQLARGLRAIWRDERKKLGVAEEADSDLPVPQALRHWATAAFGRLVDDAHSLQHPAVGWLYALERRTREAREFAWNAQRCASTLAGCGVKRLPEDRDAHPLQARIHADGRVWTPERQHIVPFAIARRLSNAGKESSRSTSSSANDIGNLTWLSARQNGLDGFGDRWMVLDESDDEERKNLGARGFLSEHQGARMLDLYNKMRGRALAKASGNQDALAETYARFCRGRREWMKMQMAHWLEEELPPGASELLLGENGES